MSLQTPEDVAALPYTSQLVYHYINEADRPPLYREIHADLNMEKSTARNGIDRLLDAGVLDRRKAVRSPRGFEYYIPEADSNPFDTASGTKRSVEGESQS